MKLAQFGAAEFSRVFDIDMAPAGPVGFEAAPRAQAGWGIVRPGESSAPHRHDESESFVIISGSGVIESDESQFSVKAGDVISFAPFEQHRITNTAIIDLVFADFYWRDPGAAAEASATAADVITGRPIFVISTPPTPNGDLHIGHLSGPYIGADVFTRFQRLNGAQAYHLTGSDDFQSYVVGCARREGATPQATASKYATAIQATLAAADIDVHQFTISSDNQGYIEGLRTFFSRVEQSGAVKRISGPALFDGQTGDYLYEVDVRGRCPACGEGCGGNICEACGIPNVVADMIEPVSSLSAKPPLTAFIERVTLDLQACAPHIRAHHATNRLPPRLRQLTERVLRETTSRIPLTHPASWGVTPESAPDGGQVIWVWPEMAYGFLYGIEKLGAGYDKAAPADDWKIVHFFGYDNSFYHAILYPALYALAYPDWRPDIDYHYNEFYLLEGLKFSTSRRHAIWGRDILSAGSVDAVRLYLCLTRGETARTNFQPEEFEAFNARVLCGEWQGWLTSLGDVIAVDFGGAMPDAGNWTAEHIGYLDELATHLRALSRRLGAAAFSLNQSAAGLAAMVADARRFATAQAPLRGVPGEQDRWRTAVALQGAAAALLAQVTAPVMPRFSAALAAALGMKPVTSWPSLPQLLPAATPVSLADAVFFQPVAARPPARAAAE